MNFSQIALELLGNGFSILHDPRSGSIFIGKQLCGGYGDIEGFLDLENGTIDGHYNEFIYAANMNDALLMAWQKWLKPSKD